MCNVRRQEVVSQLIKLIDSLNMSAYDCFLLLEDPNVAVYLGVAKLFIAEVPQRSGNLVFTFMVEKNEESPCVVIDLELRAHRLLNTADQAASQDDVVDRFTFELTDVVGSWLGIHDHADCDRREYFGFTGLVVLAPLLATVLLLASAITTPLVVAELLWVEKATRAAV